MKYYTPYSHTLLSARVCCVEHPSSIPHVLSREFADIQCGTRPGRPDGIKVECCPTVKLGFEKSCWQKLKETSSLGGPVGPAMPPPSAPFRTNAEGDAFYAKYPCSKYALFIMVALAGVVLFFIGAVWRPSALSYKNKHRLTEKGSASQIL